MLLQVKVPAEAFAADVAGKGLFLVMSVHVECQVVDLVEGFGTYCAFVLFLAAVGQFVVFVVAFLVKALSAEFAHIGLVPLMYSHMSVKR